MNWGNSVPTVTNATCSSGSNCAAGSRCTSSSQCATGNCCAYIQNFAFKTSVFNSTTYPGSLQYSSGSATTTYSVNSQAAYNAYLSSAFFSGRYCLSNIEGTSTTSYYSASIGWGMATASNLTSDFITYQCNSQV